MYKKLFSFDPVALDKASVGLVNKAPVFDGSILTDKSYHEDEDNFNHIHRNTNWETGLKYGEELGMGTLDYELLRV